MFESNFVIFKLIPFDLCVSHCVTFWRQFPCKTSMIYLCILGWRLGTFTIVSTAVRTYKRTVRGCQKFRYRSKFEIRFIMPN